MSIVGIKPVPVAEHSHEIRPRLVVGARDHDIHRHSLAKVTLPVMSGRTFEAVTEGAVTPVTAMAS